MDETAREQQSLVSSNKLTLTETSREPSPTSSNKSRPRVAQRPLLPLLPKPTPQPPEKPSLPLQTTNKSPGTPTRNPISGCLVPICSIPQCRLRTHHQFDPQGSFKKPFESPSSALSSPNIPPQRLDISILGRGIDALPSLPVDNLDEPQLRRLFHLFFTRDWPRISALIIPPAFTDSERTRAIALKDSGIQTALSDAVYCLNIIASTHLQDVYMTNYQIRDKLFEQLHGKILSLLRTKLSNFTPIEVEDVIPVMFTVVQFDLVLGNFTLMEGHRRALSHLVTSRGGVHNIGRSLSLLMNLDRIISVCIGKRPVFAEWIDRAFLSPVSIPFVYGSGVDLQFKVSDVDSNVTNYCKDVCRAIEILEAEKWAFNLGDQIPQMNVGNVHYFYFLKNLVANEFAHLQAWDFSATRKSRSVLFAANIVQYTTLQDCYIVPFAIFLADRLRESLELREIHKEWAGWEDVLRWILCVVLCIPREWDGKTWAFTTFTNILDRKYARKKWPSNWAILEAQNVRKFVWSDTRLGERLKEVFREMD